jgi:hypothetical protein
MAIFLKYTLYFSYTLKNFTNQAFCLTGVFSALGNWSHEEQKSDDAWIFCPPAFSMTPIAAGSIIYANKLSISLQISPVLCPDPQITQRVVAAWKNQIERYAE